MQTISYLSLFSGIGGFELGFENSSSQKPETNPSQSRFQCVGFSEIDALATKIYQRHFPDHKAFGEIESLNISALPKIDLLVGGFPCQSFSMAGLRGGFEDKRGYLFFSIARILDKKQPRFVLLENVQGLLSHEGGETFRQILAVLDELGYDLQWQVLNSKDFGVPQNRKRIYIVGHLRETCRPEIFPLMGEAGPGCQITARAQGLKGYDCLKRIYSPLGADLPPMNWSIL
jgi:DNA (cytosine-5)-methyltransferase 1